MASPSCSGRVTVYRPDFKQRDAAGGLRIGRRAAVEAEVQVLAGHHLEAQRGEDLPKPGSCGRSDGRGVEQAIRPDEGQIAGQDRCARAEPRRVGTLHAPIA